MNFSFYELGLPADMEELNHSALLSRYSTYPKTDSRGRDFPAPAVSLDAFLPSQPFIFLIPLTLIPPSQEFLPQ